MIGTELYEPEQGILQNGKTIAVKKLCDVHLDDNQFDNEVTYLIGAKHKNIVQLLGYCAESRKEAVEADGKYVMAEIRHRLICFEYVNNKSLHDYISGTVML
jgi:interleukin-1 receptor-associated kinase 1